MHIPDGFIAPQVYIPAYAVAGSLWGIGLKRLRSTLEPDAVPRLAVVTAAAFVLMLITIPLPGGTTVHLTGVGMIAVLFGVWNTFLSLSLVFLMQALMFGDGGITALPINALALGLVGSVSAVTAKRLFYRFQKSVALFLAGWLSVVIPAAIVAVVLGIQPLIAHTADGAPLFFPFGLKLTLPAVILPHLVVGVGDGLLTVMAWRVLKREDQS